MPDPRLDRLEAEMREMFQRVSANEKALAALPFIREDVADIKDDCSATRGWVDKQLREATQREQKKEELSLAQKAAVIGAAAVILSSLIGAIAGLINAGVFG